MALTDAELDVLRRLEGRLQRDLRDRLQGGERIPGFLTLRSYYQGMQRLVQLGLAVPEELRAFVTIVAWPRTYVDAIVGRVHPQGFLLGGEADEEFWRIWQANNLDSEFRMALVDKMVYGRGYLCAGTREDDPKTPLITVESPLQMIHEWSNVERRVTAAARFYSENLNGNRNRYATLYLPDSTIWVKMDGGRWIEDPERPRDDHEFGRCLVRVLVNRASSDDRYGESEIRPIITLTDAAARALTLAQVATEVMGIPQRTAAGMSLADFTDPATGEMVTEWEAYFGAVWATANPNAKFHQFTAADLGNFVKIVSHYAQLVAGITGLPMRYLGQLSDNPPSADGIRADESRIVQTAEEKQASVKGELEATMIDGRELVADGDLGIDFTQMATDWRPAATPSQSQAADAATKLHAEGLISRKEALRAMGKSPAQIKTILQELEDEALDPVTRRMLANVGADNGADVLPA